ncbi:hypothetical protein [Saccharopolyspora sp. ASAGF58]|uniref:hypothetical protein n=1 Tax=Saccharopolyspora sp. ASAGF58 TaxID=2719023 RepID=UPI00143FECFC|nr:hypothetical protein [Saccharopolyspora sp. ASAGF58]QIZ37227.1 hypothetical protein FDZ84_24620 [Saccharopolyspora sp. ASAGF58]
MNSAVMDTSPRRLREEMLERIKEAGYAVPAAVEQASLAVERHDFVPEASLAVERHDFVPEASLAVERHDFVPEASLAVERHDFVPEASLAVERHDFVPEASLAVERHDFVPEASLAVERHDFVPEASLADAYAPGIVVIKRDGEETLSCASAPFDCGVAAGAAGYASGAMDSGETTRRTQRNPPRWEGETASNTWPNLQAAT